MLVHMTCINKANKRAKSSRFYTKYTSSTKQYNADFPAALADVNVLERNVVCDFAMDRRCRAASISRRPSVSRVAIFILLMFVRL